MPHLVILYSANVEADADMALFCRRAADVMLSVRTIRQAGLSDRWRSCLRLSRIPFRGRRWQRRPWLHLSAAADDCRRSAAVHKAVGHALSAAASSHFTALLDKHKVGMTLQIDEGHEVFDAKIGNLHAVFQKN